MNENDTIVEHFAKYCSQCNGLCCKRGVFSVFNWEMDKLSDEFKKAEPYKISDERGASKDIAIDTLCVFSKSNGCSLPKEKRPTDCLTYPFYPKLKDKRGPLNIDHFVIDTKCPFNEEIGADKILINAVKSFWKNMENKVTNNEVTDWIGENGCWHSWYKDASRVKDE
jgi:Fe-S-cluster containining protein